MKTIKLVVSDLHVGDGDPLLDGFGERQQAAWEGLLAAVSGNSGSPLGDANDVELIINGDGFDFLMVAPYGSGGVMDASLAVEKLRNITTAHRSILPDVTRVCEPARTAYYLHDRQS